MGRTSRLMVVLGLGLMALGCTSWTQQRRPDPAAVQGPVEKPEASQLVGYMNRRAQRLQGISVDTLYLDATGAPEIRGSMACQKPRNFRLTGKKFSIPQVDLGSNDQEFWYWVKQGGDHLYHCNHNAYSQGVVQLNFPFEPDWVLQALGMADYDPNDPYEVRMKQDTIELVQTTRSTQGQPIRKITVFDRLTIRPQMGGTTKPQVRGYVIQDMGGQTLATAEINEVSWVSSLVTDPTTGEQRQDYISYPVSLSLNWPQQEMQLDLLLREVTVNPSGLPSGLFQRPRLRNIDSLDLARQIPMGQPSSNLRQVGATYRRGWR